MLATNVIRFGREEEPSPRILLRAGPLTLDYENGDLRYIRLREQMVLLRVYVAIRDHNWGTVQPIFSNVEMNIGADAFRISYDVENKQGDIDFVWRGEIEGGADGTIRFSMDGESRSTFQRNRIGFCVLHPMGLAGAPCQIEHGDGSVDDVLFPAAIAPQLVVDGEIKPVIPFNEMTAMTYPVGEGVMAEIRFQGDIFEMEDQRNWTDASYKTYCTPLRLPFPVEIEAGMRIGQAVTVRLHGDIAEAKAEVEERRLKVEVLAAAGKPLPQIGLGIASHGQALIEREVVRLRALNLAHLRAGLRLSEPDYGAKLRQAADEAEAIGVQLEVALFLSDDAEAELTGFVKMLAEIKPLVGRWQIFHANEKSTSAKWIRLARRHLAAFDATIPIGSGTNVFFTELNRQRPPIADLDLICYSLNPQVHAFDNLSLVETLPAQAATVASARAFCGDKPLTVTPITLKMRFNPNATGPEPEPGPGELPSQVDERQMSLFGAAWTVGSLKYLAESGVQSLTYYETTGWHGVMETATGSPAPDLFRSLPDAVFPMYHVFADVGEFAGGEVLETHSSNNLLVEALALRRGTRRRLLVANLSHETQTVEISGLPGQVAVRVLDETNAEFAMLEPGEFRAQGWQPYNTTDGLLRSLRPYAVASIDG